MALKGMAKQLSKKDYMYATSGFKNMTAMIDKESLYILQSCVKMKTKEQHIAQIVKEDKSRTKSTSKIFDSLVERGLIITFSSFQKTLNDFSEKKQPAPFKGILVRTCDRPSHIKRLIASIETYEHIFKNGYDYYFVDDTRDTEIQKENEAIVKSAKAKAHYIGFGLQSKIVNKFVKKFPKYESIIKWALEPREEKIYSAGRVSNIINLMCAGGRYVTVDDDFVLVPKLFNKEESVNLSLSVNMGIKFFDSYQEAQQSGIAYQKDVIKEHLRYCGHNFSELIGDIRKNRPMKFNINNNVLDSFVPYSVCKRSWGGTYGDPLQEASIGYYTLAKEHRELFCTDEKKYRERLFSPVVARYPNNITLAPQLSITPVAIDNSEVLPPSIPLYRLEDLFINRMIQILYPNNLSINLPICLGHFRDEKRGMDTFNHEPLKYNFAEIIVDLIVNKTQHIDALDIHKRYHYLSTVFQDLANAHKSIIVNRVNGFVIQKYVQLLETFKNTLAKNADGAPYWKKDLKKIIGINQIAFTGLFKTHIPIKEFDTMNEVYDAVIENSSMYADLLVVWPYLWEYAKQEEVTNLWKE